MKKVAAENRKKQKDNQRSEEAIADSGSSPSARILHLEDNRSDAKLIETAIKKGIPRALVTHVETQQHYESELKCGNYDLVLSDYRMPMYDGDQALAYAQEHCPEIPFIMVTGELGEDFVLERLKKGAFDYVLKDNLKRLIPSIEHALTEAAERRKRVEAEEALKRSEEKYRELLSSIQDAFYSVDHAWHLVYANQQALEFWNRTSADLLGQQLYEVFPEAAGTDAYDRLHRAMQERTVEHFESISAVTGRWVEVHAYPTASGGLAIYLRNISKRKQAEEALRENQEQLKNILSTAMDAVIALDEGQRIILFNTAAEKMFHTTASEAIGQPIDKFLPERFRQEHHAHIDKFGKTNVTQRAMGRLGAVYGLRKNGVEFPIEASISQVSVSGKKVFTVILRDITERRRDEQQLREALEEAEEGRNTLHALMEHIPMGITIADAPDVTIRMVSTHGQKILERSESEIAHIPAPAHVSVWGIYRSDGVTPGRPEDLPLTRATVQGEVVRNEEWIVTRKDGTLVPIVCNAAPIRDKDGEIVGGVVGWQDITEERLAAKALAESENRFRDLANNISQLAWMADEKGWISWYNERWFDYTGTTLEEMQGWGWQKVHHPDYVGPVTEKFKRHLETQEAWEDIFPLRSKRGEFRWFLSRALPIKDEHGKVVRWFGTNTDITDLRKAQEEIRTLNEELEQHIKERTEELVETNKELESFSYSVSHDLKAPLRAIAGFSKVLLDEAREKLNNEEQHYLDVIAENATRMSRLVEELLTFSRLGKKEILKERVDLRALAAGIVNRYQETEPARSIRVTLHNDMPPALADPTLIRQVMENLISNAFKFTSKRSEAAIEVGFSKHGTETAYYVRDNGAGFDMQYYDKLFSVFQRLHDATDYEGTGVGLAFSKRIIQRHGGKIWAVGEIGKGATFFFSLPGDHQ